MFQLIKIENGRQNVPEPEYLEATAAEAIAEGEALVLSSGKLTKCGATAKPAYIAMGAVTAAATKRTVPVMRVVPEMLFEVATSADCSEAVVGSKVTLHTDGMKVTATTTSGVVTVVNLNGAGGSGDKIIVRIV